MNITKRKTITYSTNRQETEEYDRNGNLILLDIRDGVFHTNTVRRYDNNKLISESIIKKETNVYTLKSDQIDTVINNYDDYGLCETLTSHLKDDESRTLRIKFVPVPSTKNNNRDIIFEETNTISHNKHIKHTIQHNYNESYSQLLSSVFTHTIIDHIKGIETSDVVEKIYSAIDGKISHKIHTDVNGNSTTKIYHYDDNHNLRKITDESGNVLKEIVIEHDQNGNIIYP